MNQTLINVAARYVLGMMAGLFFGAVIGGVVGCFLWLIDLALFHGRLIAWSQNIIPIPIPFITSFFGLVLGGRTGLFVVSYRLYHRR